MFTPFLALSLSCHISCFTERQRPLPHRNLEIALSVCDLFLSSLFFKQPLNASFFLCALLYGCCILFRFLRGDSCAHSFRGFFSFRLTGAFGPNSSVALHRCGVFGC